MAAIGVDKDSPGVIVSRNPSDGSVLGEVKEMGVDEVRAAVSRARAAQARWGALPARERGRVILRVRDALRTHADELCRAISAEGGKTVGEAMTMEVLVVIDLATYFAKRVDEILAPRSIPLHLLKNRASYVHYVPRGVVGVIAPWNFPFSIPMGETLMALLAGNGVVLKPSEMTPMIALLAKRILDGAGLDPDLFQVITGRGATGAALIDAGIDYCVFTGSVATGRRIAVACGERLIPCTLELGGKAAAIVCADADLARTARALVWGAFANSGQVCVSVERVLAQESIHDELLERITAETKKLRQGDPAKSEVDVGAMSWDGQLAHVERIVKQAVDAGPRLVTGGQRSDARNLFFAPTVLADCKPDMDVMRKEIFGPVMPIMKVRDDEEAVRIANDSHLGLMGYVFTRDTQRGKRIAERIASGTVMINDCLLTFGAPETPWGGVKQSGIGRTHSADGLRELCEMRHVNYDRLALSRELWWYPYSDKLYRRTLSALRWIFR